MKSSAITLFALAVAVGAATPDQADAFGRRRDMPSYCKPVCCDPCPPICYLPCPPLDNQSNNQGTNQTTDVCDKVHALFILGTKDKVMAQQITNGGEAVKRLFETNDPLRRKVASSLVLSGDGLTADGVLNACQELGEKAGKNDSLFVFYCGHGAYQDGGHLLLVEANRSAEVGAELKSGAGVKRTDIVSRLKMNSPRFICFVTDACAEKLEIEIPVGGTSKAAPGAGPQAAIVRLMLENKGVLDVNSCTEGEKAWVDKRYPLFTKVFVDLASRTTGYDKDNDGKLSWKNEFLPDLKAQTNEAFLKYKRDPLGTADPSVQAQTAQTTFRFETD